MVEENARPTATVGKRKSVKTLAWRMQEGLHERKRSALSEGKDKKENYADSDMTGLQQFALQNVTEETAGDFLMASTANPQNRVWSLHFITATRTYLGLPVTGAFCNVDRCRQRPLHGDGDNTEHVRGALNRRHTGVKKALGSVMGILGKGVIGQAFEVNMEVPMSREFILRSNVVDPGCDDFADFMTVSSSNHKQAFDVVIGHSDKDNANHWNAHGAVNEAAVEKHAKYCKWQIHKEDVIPLAFSTYKATAKETLQFFKNLAFNLGDGDTERTAKVLRRIRETVAMELVKGQGRVIAEFNKKNHKWTSTTN
jgi:hypothetical protein